jgi:hypothetical protein
MCSDGRGLHNIAAVPGVMGLAGDADFAILAGATDPRNSAFRTPCFLKLALLSVLRRLQRHPDAKAEWYVIPTAATSQRNGRKCHPTDRRQSMLYKPFVLSSGQQGQEGRQK